MDIRQIEIFLKAAECGSFTTTAKEMYITQQNVSKRIAELERELGVNLFERMPRKSRLTEAGRIAYEKFSKVDALLNDSVSAIRNCGYQEEGSLRLGIFAGIQKKIMDSYFSALSRAVSPAGISLFIFDTPSQFSYIEKNDLDLFFTMIGGAENERRYTGIHLGIVEFKIIVAKNHPWTQKTCVTQQDMAQEDYICGPKKLSESEDKSYGVVPCRKKIHMENPESMFANAMHSNGFCIHPEGDEKSRSFEVAYLDCPVYFPPLHLEAVYAKSNKRAVLRKAIEALQIAE